MPQSSSETAKERLRVVLLADHLSLAPEVVDLLKADLLDVIRRYVEIDEENVDLTFEQRDKEVAMLASVPILSVKGSFPPDHESKDAADLEPQEEAAARSTEAEGEEEGTEPVGEAE